MARNEMDPAELLKKALVVQNLDSLGAAPQMSHSELRDKLTIHFQKKLNHGGDVEKVIYPLNSSTDVAIVLFEDGKDRESAVQHEQVFYSQLLNVRRFPSVFTSIQAKIDPFIFSIMPLEAASGFKFTLQKVTGVNVNPNNCGEISCSSKAQLDHVEREVVRQVYPQKVAVFSDCFEVAGASNFSLEPSSHQQTSLEEFGGISKSDELLAEENTDERDDPVNLTSSSKQTEGPEKFFDAQSDGDEAGVGEGVKSSQDTDVIVDKYKYNYLRVFESQIFQKLSKTYNVKFEVKKGDCTRVDVVASKTKTPAHDVDKARDEFIEFYQKASFDIERKTVDCSTVSRKAIEEAMKKTQSLFKTDTLITKVDKSPEKRLILRRGDVEQVARHFRDAAGIKSGRKLRATGSSNDNNPKSNAASQVTAFQDAEIPTRKEPATGFHNSSSTSYSTPSQDTWKSGGDIATYPAKFVTNEGMNILVLEGDITKQAVGAIVNPSTSALNNNGGVAKAIVLAAGHGLEKACAEIMRSRQHFQVTECVTTSGFHLKCLIIHAVGPTLSSGQYFSSELYNTFLNCLHEADQQKLSSLAIPLIGAGSLGAYKSVCSNALVGALLQFSCESGRPKFVRDVLLVNIDRESTTEILRSLQAAFNVQHNTSFLASSSTLTSGSGFSQPTYGEVRMPGVASRVQWVPSRSQQTTACLERPKPGESIGQVKEDQHSTVVQPRSKHVPPDNDLPTTAESKGQVKTNQKGSTDGNAADDGANENRPAPHDSKPADKSKRSTVTAGSPLDGKPRVQSTGDEKDKCPICFDDKMTDAVTLTVCKHQFCKKCIDEALKSSYRCPVCQTVCSQPKGNQPYGTMKHTADRYLHLPGYEQDGAIIIDYYIPDGMQSAEHPNPGKRFSGTSRTAYLPDNQEGREVLRLLKKAFDARLIFTVGRSVTSGLDDTVTWNDIHHKTCRSGGSQNYGYPDPDYLKRVKEDLAAKGIQ